MARADGSERGRPKKITDGGYLPMWQHTALIYSTIYTNPLSTGGSDRALFYYILHKAYAPVGMTPYPTTVRLQTLFLVYKSPLYL